MDTSEIDPELWVDILDGGRGLLVGNPHTFPGRFNVLLTDEQEVLSCSLEDIVRASPASHYWIRGYLSGNEPSPYLFFGDQADSLSDDSIEMKTWRETARIFRETGRLTETDHCQSCGALQLPGLPNSTCRSCEAPREEPD